MSVVRERRAKCDWEFALKSCCQVKISVMMQMFEVFNVCSIMGTAVGYSVAQCHF